MATSGDKIITSTRNKIITGAFRLLGLTKAGGSRTAEEINNAGESLNELITLWQTEGIGQWLQREVTLFLEVTDTEKEYYDLGPSGDNATLTSYETALAVAGETSDSAIEVDSDDDITDGDYIGIELDDGTMQWTTVNGTPSGDDVILTTALTGDAAVDNVVYNYTAKIARPVSIDNIRLRNSSGLETLLTSLSRAEYMALNDKDTAGTVSQVYYEPRLTNSRLYVWATTNTVKSQIMFTAKIPIELFSDHDDEAHFPQEWLSALKYNLAVMIAPEYSTELTPQGLISAMNVIVPMARQFKAQVKDFDIESGSICLAPDLR